MIRWIRESFQRELLLGFIVVALVPLILTSGFLVQLFKVKLAKDYQRQDIEQAQQIEQTLEQWLEQFENVAEQLCTDDAVIDAMPKAMFLGKRELYTKLYTVTDGMREVAEFELYTAEGVCKCSTGDGAIESRLPLYWGALRIADAHAGELVLCSEKSYVGDTEPMLRAARAIRDEDENTVGYLVMNIRAENFANMLENLFGGQDGICVVDRFWEEVYSEGSAKEWKIAGVLRACAMAGESAPSYYEGNGIYIEEVGDRGLFCIYMRRTAFTEDTIQAMYRVILVMALFCLLLCIGVALKLSGNLTRPISTLAAAMQQVQEGKLDVQIETGRQDELSRLGDNFNTMTVELKEYMEHQVRQQQELNEANIAMMQAQLNPHFLYNTLDTMKWVAKANGIQELAVMATKLANILRTSISKEQFVTLKEEMQLVESYAEIQKIRFHGRFCYEDEVPEELLDCIVPKLIVQPIVENAVIHGLADSENGHVTVKVTRRERKLLIQVEDDGCGISPDMMSALNERKTEKRDGHIGFYNVDTIIRLNYGEEYGAFVEARPEGGTRVKLVLPAEKERRTNVKGSGGR